MASVLIVDDDVEICRLFQRTIQRMGHTADLAHGIIDGIQAARNGEFDVILLDVLFPEGSSLDHIEDIRQVADPPEIIIMTGAGDPGGAEMALKAGVWDYLQKSVHFEAISLSLQRALDYRKEKQAARRIRPVALKRGRIVGDSKELLQCLDLVAQAAASDASVLVTGETGTGKELVAEAIHLNSRRSEGPFITVDCASLPKTLAESVLFGHVKGSFTGAHSNHVGLIESANGGTLFLDELGELNEELQKPFLRVLENKRFRPVGSSVEKASDFRIIAATNRNLPEMVASGEFREDLYFRIRSFAIEMPPLRDRKGDIPLIVGHCIDRYCRAHQIEPKGVSTDFLSTLRNYSWPGNVRELVNVVERAICVAVHQPTLYSTHLPVALRITAVKSNLSDDESGSSEDGTQPTVAALRTTMTYKEFRDQMSKQYLIGLLGTTRNNMKEACRVSGLSRARLYQLFKEFEISSKDPR